MEQYKLGDMEQRFADIIWDNEPISSGNLVTICQNLLSWKKSTTYTMLKRLCQRGIFENENGIVVAKMSREDFKGAQGEQFVSETFAGSLPQFLAAFTRRKKLTDREIKEIQSLIDNHKEE